VKRALGAYPFHEAAFLGGAESLRGFSSQRFAGDASALGTAELRLFLGRYFLVLPGEYGVFALADAGRVWLEGERSRRWHAAYGGGLWFAYLRRDHTVTVAAARSDEKTGLYLSMGFSF
jgi:hemolysin activation/secretion protein